MLEKISLLPPVYWLWGTFFFAFGLHFLWCQFVAYPAAFERQLRRAKPWVYVTLRWKGGKKWLILSLSRLFLIVIAGEGTALFIHYTQKKQTWTLAFVACVLLLAVIRLDAFWTHLRYRQQEDVYYHLHDVLRAKLDQEGKDPTEAQVRSLAAYQHQQRLHKADESGRFLAALRQEAGLARRAHTSEPRPGV